MSDRHVRDHAEGYPPGFIPEEGCDGTQDDCSGYRADHQEDVSRPSSKSIAEKLVKDDPTTDQGTQDELKDDGRPVGLILSVVVKSGAHFSNQPIYKITSQTPPSGLVE